MRGRARLGLARRGLAGPGNTSRSSRKTDQQFTMSDDNQNTDTNNDGAEVLTLPLWKNCLDGMLAVGVNYGDTFSAKFFEEHLKSNQDTMEFGLAVSAIRRELEKRGFYLNGRGQNGEQYVIVQAASNCDVMLSYQRRALDAMRRGVILGTNTPLALLKGEDRRRHEAVLERLAKRTALLGRRMPATLAQPKNQAAITDGK